MNEDDPFLSHGKENGRIGSEDCLSHCLETEQFQSNRSGAGEGRRGVCVGGAGPEMEALDSWQVTGGIQVLCSEKDSESSFHPLFLLCTPASELGIVSVAWYRLGKGWTAFLLIFACFYIFQAGFKLSIWLS